MADFVVPGTQDTHGTFTPLSTTGGTLDVNGSFSATLAPFAPNGNGTILAAGTASGNVLLPAGTVVEVFNPGTATAYVKFGTSNAVTAGTTDLPIAAGVGNWLGFAVGSNTYMAGITSAGSSTLTIAGGAGLPTGASAGAGGSGGSVTQGTSPWVVGGTVVAGGTVALSGTSAVSGTVSATQSGTWTVQPGNTANTTAWKVDGSAVTQPVSGTVATTGTVAATGTLTTVQATGTNLHTVVDAGTLTLLSALTGITNAVTLGAAAVLIGHIDGAAASGATVSGNPVFAGGRAQNVEATAVTNGQAVGSAFDLVGRQITTPYANKENYTGGAITQTGTTAGTIVAALGSGVKFYATSVIISNSGTANSEVLFNDSVGVPFPAPTVGGVVLSLPVPLVFAANTAVTATPTVASTSIKTSLIGYKGT